MHFILSAVQLVLGLENFAQGFYTCAIYHFIINQNYISLLNNNIDEKRCEIKGAHQIKLCAPVYLF